MSFFTEIAFMKEKREVLYISKKVRYASRVGDKKVPNMIKKGE